MKIGKELLYLSRADVVSCEISMAECIDTIEAAHTAKGRGETEMPPKPLIGSVNGEGFLEAFAARIPASGSVGVKWLGGCKDNPPRGLPAITGLIILNDPETWLPVAVMDCTHITALRTAAVNGVALRWLANPNAETIGVLGCGLQGRTNLAAALCECKNIKNIYAWSPNIETAKKYAAEMSEKLSVKVTAAERAYDVVADADVLLSCTPFGDPDSFRIIEPSWLKKGVTAVPVSADNHFYADALALFDRFYTDDIEMFRSVRAEKRWCAHYTGEPTELSALLAGRAEGRQSRDERIILITGGIGINDVSVAKKIYERALERKAGTLLEL